MELMNEGQSFIPFAQAVKRASNWSLVHSSPGKDDASTDGNLTFDSGSLNSSLNESTLQLLTLKRAAFTFKLPCSQILVTNAVACSLLSYKSEELRSMKLQEILNNRSLSILVDSAPNDSSGCKREKFVELLTKDGSLVPASVMFRKIDSPHRYLALFEPLDRKTLMISIDLDGKILTCDDETSAIFQYETAAELIGSNVKTIIPAIEVSRENGCGERRLDSDSKQNLTGRSKNGVSFPLSLILTQSSPGDDSVHVIVWIHLNLSGLIILNSEFNITNCNYQFSRLLFGAGRDQILNQKITRLIPNFCEDVIRVRKMMDASRRSERSDSSRNRGRCRLSLFKLQMKGKDGGRSGRASRKACNYCESAAANPPHASAASVRLSKSDCDIRRDGGLRGCPRGRRNAEDAEDAEEEEEEEGRREASQRSDMKKYNSDEFALRTKQMKANEANRFDYKHLGLKDGYFSGYGKHCDGSDIDIFYKVKIISFGDKVFYCVWISSDSWQINDVDPIMPKNATETSSVISTSLDEYMTKDNSCNEELARQSSASIMSYNDETLTAGDYSVNYTNIQQIGKGAFGYVKMAFRHSDGLLVVTKFIKKHKINVRSWVYDPKWNTKIPLEISLLSNLKHPNIVEVLDVFHNDSFFQLVMKKHGAGMDLFEFIERKPKSDEKLNSYIFRQIISAVHYLDSIGVLHRDIKDENVIINEKFEVKLIDFGSAAFMTPNKLFSVFYGTVEYCSPEVLQGSKYRGPELEIWALGVTLYVLTFGENPFYDIEETIKGRFSIPTPISSQLFDLLHRMLEKDVSIRITISKVVANPWIQQPVDVNSYRFEDVVHCNNAEAEPPRFVTEFTFGTCDTKDDNSENDCEDRTMASSNSLCSLQTTENTENFDQYDENLQEYGGEFLTDDSLFKSSTPVSGSSSNSINKKSRDVPKSAGALNRICENSVNFDNQMCDVCSYNNFVKKRFSLDINILKRLSNSTRYSDSECSFQDVGGVESRDNYNEKLDLDLINDLDDMKLGSNESGSQSYMYDSHTCDSSCAYEGFAVDEDEDDDDDDNDNDNDNDDEVDEEEEEEEDDDDGDEEEEEEEVDPEEEDADNCERRRRRRHQGDGDGGDGGVKNRRSRKRTASRDTEESDMTAYPEFYDTSDSRSFDGDDSEFFWDAENDKLRSSGNY